MPICLTLKRECYCKITIMDLEIRTIHSLDHDFEHTDMSQNYSLVAY